MTLEESGRALCGVGDVPSEAAFRAAGFTAAAAHFPLSLEAYERRCVFNGVRPDQAPFAWRYAPNATTQAQLERKPPP